jgi:hypothetical protein
VHVPEDSLPHVARDARHEFDVQQELFARFLHEEHPIAALLARGQHRIEHLDDACRRAKHETEDLVAIFIEQKLEHRIDLRLLRYGR